MTAAAAALAKTDYTIPTVIYSDKRNRVQRKSNQYLFHGAWAFLREAFERVGGYPFIQSGQDQSLLQRFKAAMLRRTDPIQHDPRQSYVYRWPTAHSTHIWTMGTNGWAIAGAADGESRAALGRRLAGSGERRTQGGDSMSSELDWDAPEHAA